jgi:hypothetical protein
MKHSKIVVDVKGKVQSYLATISSKVGEKSLISSVTQSVFLMQIKLHRKVILGWMRPNKATALSRKPNILISDCLE